MDFPFVKGSLWWMQTHCIVCKGPARGADLHSNMRHQGSQRGRGLSVEQIFTKRILSVELCAVL